MKKQTYYVIKNDMQHYITEQHTTPMKSTFIRTDIYLQKAIKFKTKTIAKQLLNKIHGTFEIIEIYG